MTSWGNERDVEVPFLLNHIRGKKVLDVGADRDNFYTTALLSRGITVVTCDPWEGAHADYPVRFEDLETDEKFDTIIFLSSLEHFTPDEDNLGMAANDAECISKARTMLNPDGVIIITVPLGAEKIYYDNGRPDFIQWSSDRTEDVQWLSDAIPLVEEVYYWIADGWVKLDRESWALCDNLEYRDNGAKNAAAVYCGVWCFDNYDNYQN